MYRGFKSAAFMTVLGVTTAIALPAQAQKMTLMDYLRGGKKTEENTVQQTSVSPAPPVRNIDPEPLPKVVGPKYYTYKTEQARKINTSGFTGGLQTVSMSASPNVAKAIEDYYAKGAAPVWLTDGVVNDKAKAVLKFFETVSESGLNPSDYIINVPSMEVTASIADDENTAPDAESGVAVKTATIHPAMLSFELALSARVLAYVQDVNRGRIDPNKLSGYHDFKRKTVNLGPILNLARLSPDVAALLKSREPNHPNYIALKEKLAALREQSGSNDRIELPSDLLLKPGQTNAALPDVLRAISRKASDELKSKYSAIFNAPSLGNVYEGEVVDLVKSFQEEQGLKPDGVIGRASVRAMVGDSDAAKIEKLIVALEQIRWLPNDLGDRFVFINQPAFMAYYHENHAEQFGMKVVIGSKANQTYFFQDEIQTVEVNPYWGVPQSIIVNEMLPKLRRDPSYLDRSGYEVQVAGRKVASSNVDWNSTTRGISVRQPPGKDNALGELKILFPNAHAIYMHDTPSKSFFNRDNRALSHGCIRLAEPRKMAAAVLGTTVQKVGEQIASGQNRAIQVPRKIPVYVAYFTAWPNKDGKVEYFDDVYGRDSYVMKAFAETSKAREKSI